MKTAEPPVIKQPRHIAIAQRHLIAQLNKAGAVRDKAAKEVEGLNAALSSLGWPEE